MLAKHVTFDAIYLLLFPYTLSAELVNKIKNKQHKFV